MHGLGWVAGASAVVGTTAAALFAPVRFPRPSGDSRVGTVTRQWVDHSRREVLARDADEARELAVQVWYPTVESCGTRSRYRPDAPVVFNALLQALREVTSGRTSLPSFLFRKLAVSRTSALVNAQPVRETMFPVIVALSGFGGFRNAHTILIEELVSRGYVVLGMDQPYVSARARLADGRVVKMKQRGQLYRDHSREEVIAHLAADVSFALDALSSDPGLADTADTSRVAVMGVSLGGTVAAAAASSHERIAACLMMDAVMPSDVAARGLRCAAMWLTRPADDMRRERSRPGGWPEPVIEDTLGSMAAALSHQAAGTGWLVTIPGMFHIDFTDAPHWFPWARWVGLSGRIGARRAREIISGYANAFFDQTFLGHDSPLLAAPGNDGITVTTA